MSSFSRRRLLHLFGTGTGLLLLEALPLGCSGEGPSPSRTSPDRDGPRPVVPDDTPGEVPDETPEVPDTTPPDAGREAPARFPASMNRASRSELDVDLIIVDGALPEDLYGHAFVVAALPWGDGSPIANGDGMMYRLDFGETQKVPLKTRISKTPCYWADRATVGSNLAFRNNGFVRMSQGLGTRNEANTAYLRMHDRLFVTFDGGRPYEIDPVTLELVTPVGWNREWVQGLPDILNNLAGGPFPTYFSTAHPYFDPNTSETFLINYTMAMGPVGNAKTFVMRWDGQGALERFEVVLEGGGQATIEMSAHQLSATKDYVLLMDTAFWVEGDQFLNPDAVKAEKPDTTLYVIKRRDLKAGVSKVTAKKVVIPREIAHFITNYENPGGKITLHCTHGSAWLASEWLRKNDVLAGSGGGVRQDLLGMLVCGSDMTPIARHVFDAETGTIEDSKLLFHDDFTWSVNLYAHRGTMGAPDEFEHLFWTSVGFQPELLTKRVYDLSRDYKYRSAALNRLPFNGGRAASLFRTNGKTMDRADIDGYVFPAGRAVSSPLFLPARGKDGSHEGYVLVTVCSDDKSTPSSTGDEFWIFDARDLAKGPVCRLAHPELNFGYTLHTTWMDEIKRRTATYHVPVREDFEPLVSKANAEVKALFERSVYPRYA